MKLGRVQLGQRDFTVSTFEALLDSILGAGYECRPYSDFIDADRSVGKVVILRHDVDRRPASSLRLAQLEHERGVKGTFYFRANRSSFDREIIQKIGRLGHEVGYHYEDLAAANGNRAVALNSFERNLKRLREIVPVRTICMHGSPLSKWDNSALWQKGVHYGAYGIEGEPYLDLDFTRIGYLTDTGRRWDGSASIRDKVRGEGHARFQSTFDVMRAFTTKRMPRQLMLTVHPQRWTESLGPWAAELVAQNVKNQVKRLIIALRRATSL